MSVSQLLGRKLICIASALKKQHGNRKGRKENVAFGAFQSPHPNLCQTAGFGLLGKESAAYGTRNPKVLKQTSKGFETIKF